MVPEVWFLGVLGLLGCRPLVELGSTGAATGGDGAAWDAGSAGDAGRGGSASSGEGGTDTGGSSTGGQLSVARCEGVPVDDVASGVDGGTCETDDHSAEPVPVDVFIMMDRSSSMNETLAGDTTTRWEGVRQAVGNFVSELQAEGADIRVGFQYFGQSNGADDTVDCDVSLYADPRVPIGPITDTGPSILAEIEAVQPATQTPTGPALQGAYRYAKQWATTSEALGRPVVVVLVTDGLPTQCGMTSVNDILPYVQAAWLEVPPVRTFVVGIGPALDNLNNLAQAGGTDRAFLVEQGNASSALLEALLNITVRGIACEYAIPDSPDSYFLISTQAVRMLHWPDAQKAGVAKEIPKAATQAECARSSNGGWYYDRAEGMPTKIFVCPCTCALFRSGFVEIQYGCVPKPV